MKNYLRRAKALFTKYFARYIVVNRACGKIHYTFTFKSALEWLACYDVADFGATQICKRGGQIICSTTFY